MYIIIATEELARASMTTRADAKTKGFMARKPIPAVAAKPVLTFIIEAQGWKQIPRLRARLQQAAEATARHLPKKAQIPFTATVLLTGNAHIRRLNHDFRGIDKPTNVLSFPQYDPAALPKNGKFLRPVELGDIALAYAYSAKEAKQNNKLIINHASHLLVHGLLHLFGYDHIIGRQAGIMEKMETTIMASLGLPDPYALAPVTKSPRRKK